jgi:hypothetical protein
MPNAILADLAGSGFMVLRCDDAQTLHHILRENLDLAERAARLGRVRLIDFRMGGLGRRE